MTRDHEADDEPDDADHAGGDDQAGGDDDEEASSEDSEGDEEEAEEIPTAPGETDGTAEERQARYDALYNRGRFQGLQIDPDVDFYPELAGRRPGDDNITTRGFDLHPWVTFVSAGILGLFIALTLIGSDRAQSAFQGVLDGINENLGWFYILCANGFVLAAVLFAASRFGKIRIGGPSARPEFSTPGWLAMLVAAGMGIGLMFYSVAEPVSHHADPARFFGVNQGTDAAGEAAMVTTFYHWGIHPWAIYALVAIGLSFFAYNRGLPLTFRSVLYPLLGARIYGFWGNVIDVLTVLATLSGLATSLGLGVGQIATGLNYLFGFSADTGFQVVLIAAITAVATLSVVSGLDRGVKRLSEINMGLTVTFMVFLVIVGPTLFIISLFTESLGGYIGQGPQLAWWTDTFGGSGWQGEWTMFYWGWWISWSPFVGMFIARISKGRTVREIVAGVVLFPSVLSFLFLSVFGGSALDAQRREVRDIASAANEDISSALFEMLEVFPLTGVTSLLGVIVVIFFFVTSSDSGSLVVDHLTSGGKLDPPKAQRVFWAVMEGVLAAVLLVGGGLVALQSMAMTTGIPFAIVLIIMVWSLRHAFHQELELLEGHYDADIFRSRHAALLKRTLGRGREVARGARDRARGRGRPRKKRPSGSTEPAFEPTEETPEPTSSSDESTGVSS